MFDPELERFKTIDLRAYAAGQGYQLDRKASCRGSAVMRNLNNDKIIIKRASPSGHYVYFSVRDNRDNGTIIDFVQHRQNLSLRAVREELRSWIGAPPVTVPAFAPLVKTAKDRRAVEIEYALMEDALRHPYLENERALPASVLQSRRFAGRIQIDARGNAIFPHEDKEGLCGYEIKNAGFTGFAKGGEKGLWSSNDFPDDNCLMFGESGIEALSYAILFPDPDDSTRFRSLSGKPNPVQPELILEAIVAMPPGSLILTGMNADADGRALVGVVRQAFEFSGRADLRFHDHEPIGFKDWNDQLRGKQPDLFPIARVSGLDLR